MLSIVRANFKNNFNDMKPDNVTIINITVGKLGAMSETVYGLGNDNNIYFWIPSDHSWKLWA